MQDTLSNAIYWICRQNPYEQRVELATHPVILKSIIYFCLYLIFILWLLLLKAAGFMSKDYATDTKINNGQDNEKCTSDVTYCNGARLNSRYNSNGNAIYRCFKLFLYLHWIFLRVSFRSEYFSSPILQLLLPVCWVALWHLPISLSLLPLVNEYKQAKSDKRTETLLHCTEQMCSPDEFYKKLL